MARTTKTSVSAPAVVAALEYMTGSARGETVWIVENETEARLAGGKRLALFGGGAENGAGLALAARLSHKDGGYEIEAGPGRQLWVNGAAVGGGRLSLRHGDVIEFGDDGPLARISFYSQGLKPRHSVGEIIGDVRSYLRVSRRPLAFKLSQAATTFFRRILFETAVPFRGIVLIALVGVLYWGYQAQQERRRLAADAAAAAAQRASFSSALARSRSEALRPADLEALKADMAERLTTAGDRLDQLEARSQASRTVISRSLASVAFIQGGYGFKDAATGRLLRHAPNPAGGILLSPSGQPLLTLEGDGPVAERQYTGTGFALAGRPLIATNRHVALPWEEDASLGGFAARGLSPVMLRLIAYFPGETEAMPLELAAVSDAADLAILKTSVEAEAPLNAPGLPLAPQPPEQGAEVIVMGFPTGLRSLLARTGPEFVAKLQADGATGFWDVARRLAEARQISPLASRGIVGQTSAATIVYDAETTHGGSGGPVLNVKGEVVAVNMAILPEFGGSNLGAPAALLHELLETAPSD